MTLSPSLLEAAAALVAEHGADGFTMDDLALRSGLSRATLYRKVGSREAVLAALAEQGQAPTDRADTRERILDAALDVFARAGFELATIDEIAGQAGVGVATIYRQFGDKDRLILAVVHERSPRRAAREAASAPTGDLREDLTRLAEAMFAGFQAHPQLMRLMMLESLRNGPWVERLREGSPVRTLPMIAALLAPHIKSGLLRPGDPVRYAQAFAGQIMAFGLIGPLLGPLPAPEPAVAARFVTDLFLHGAMLEDRT